MKSICILIALLTGVSSVGFSSVRLNTIPEKDSIVILFGKKTQIVIHSQDKQELQQLRNYDFNALFSQVIAATEVSRHQSVEGTDTSFVANGDTVTMRGGDVTVKDSATGQIISFSVRVDAETDAPVSSDDSTVVIIKSRKTSGRSNSYRSNRRTSSEFTIDVGLNNYLENGKFPDESNAPYGLRPFGSRYVALSWLRQTRIGNKKSPLYVSYGLEFSANNFMFDGNEQLLKGDSAVFFEGVGENLDKNKLTVLYGSIPVMPMLDFKRAGRGNFKFGVGGYIGYRLHSYTKIKYADGGEKDHSRGNYYLTNFRYGLMTQVGISGINLFVKYDLNPLFSEGRGPDLNAISFGIRL